MIRFRDREPTEDFEWLFTDIDGTTLGHVITMPEYQRFKGTYGMPLGQWRPKKENDHG